MLTSMAPIWKDLDKPKKWADKTFMKISKEKFIPTGSGKRLFIAFHSGYMSQHLVYVQFNNQKYKKDIGKLGEVQWRATKMARELQHMTCRERLRDLVWRSEGLGAILSLQQSNGCYRENKARVFSEVYSKRIRGNRLFLEILKRTKEEAEANLYKRKKTKHEFQLLFTRYGIADLTGTKTFAAAYVKFEENVISITVTFTQHIMNKALFCLSGSYLFCFEQTLRLAGLAAPHRAAQPAFLWRYVPTTPAEVIHMAPRCPAEEKVSWHTTSVVLGSRASASVLSI
ncbi:hypothetical protein QYF61_026273 [Mycteria americana]|uniref:Uncharacterized protein n=1 Tax=Mycteria americana TaxID=33587 RepID=A0AAN7NN16_MYCAM|nr:hypothetical protein QYF61_026273 [Mycteria americana]